jgi:hypothetical protein
MTEQLAFSDLLTETDTLRRAALDHHRSCVQAWFDHLPESDKNRLAEVDGDVRVGHVFCSFGRRW